MMTIMKNSAKSMMKLMIRGCDVASIVDCTETYVPNIQKLITDLPGSTNVRTDVHGRSGITAVTGSISGIEADCS